MMISERKKELIYWLDSILAIKPAVFKIIGKEYFKNEYLMLEKLRNNISKVEIEESDIDRLKKSAISLLIDLNLFILNKRKVTSLFN